ncbi:MAG: hypothetical protein CVU05_07545 [Bacteroidetes bacterium HGW-Bacteroidetes-21]|jgi:hypothetical protein|nr:MAG: hypothetical protein CVU05_07545 [Bacteroidetes bacterium HGW-Bacteroidetes-21]
MVNKKIGATLFLLFIMVSGYSQVVCDLTQITTIEGYNVYNHNPSGVTLYKAKMYIDADGSPRAYGPNNSGLDWTANAGYTGNWWGVVSDAYGDPILQGPTDPYPGMYVSTTSLVNSAYGTTNPLRYVNSETVPYFVLPTALVSLGGIHIGDIAYVYNTVTGLGCYAIYADSGPAGSLGEGSIYLASQIGVNPNARTGGTSLQIIDYIVFPNSGYGQGSIPTIAQIDSIGNSLMVTLGGTGITACLESPGSDHIAPTTLVTVPTGWDTTSFTATFTDADNTGGSGVSTRFYQVLDHNGTEWRGNNSKGFFNDNFNTALHSDWHTNDSLGAWNVSSGHLNQTYTGSNKTRLSVPVAQDSIHQWLYHWQMSFSPGSSRRAGMYIMVSDPALTYLGNAYLIWFRADDDQCEIYYVKNNTVSGIVSTAACTINDNITYDIKVIYNPANGLIQAFMNNILICSYTDTQPLKNAGYISLRTGNASVIYDDIKIYKSRGASVIVSVGDAATNDIRFQNQNPSTPAGKINSVVTDAMLNISTINSQNVNIDWTSPILSPIIRDGAGNDIDTTNNGTQLQANWDEATDTNSGINNYSYAIGTTPGGTDVLGWTNNLNNLSLTASGLTLINLQNYYISIKATNVAGMSSDIVTSDGQIYDNLTSIIFKSQETQSIHLYPNPNTGVFFLEMKPADDLNGSIKITDIEGREVWSAEINAQNFIYQIDMSNQANGLYTVVVCCNGKSYKNRIVLSK